MQLPFPDCIPISRDFAGLTSKPGIYAIRHQSAGLLYVGKAQDIKERFRGGHKAITWSWLEDYDRERCSNCYFSEGTLNRERLTVNPTEAGQANQGIPDRDVLTFATENSRVVITLNRDDFIALHCSGISYMFCNLPHAAFRMRQNVK